MPGEWIYAAAAAPAWSAATSYSAGDIVSHDNFNYQALVPSKGMEPNVTNYWPGSWYVYQMIFLHGWGNDTSSGTYMPMRVGLTLGRLNVLDQKTGAVVSYQEKRLDVEGDIIGGTAGDPVCYIPAQYRQEFDVAIHAHDNNKAYIAGRLYSNGSIVLDVA